MAIQKRRSSLQAAFEARYEIDPVTGCWNWTGMLFASRGGYGAFTHRHSGVLRQRAHRVAWRIYKGEVLPPSVVLLHKCDNPLCVNPAHLVKGTQADNIADMVKKGRSAKGSKHSQAKLTEEDVYAIRKDTRLQAEIAEDYGISVPTVSDIKRRRSWGHL